MILYHASNVIVEKPDVAHSRNALDFGKGFYLTLLRDQAEKYSLRFSKRGEDAFLNIYELDDRIETFTRKVFEHYDEEWLDYIALCRKGLPHKSFDIIEGGIADDQVFDTIDLYFTGVYTKEQALDQLVYKKPNHQVCITSQALLDKHLHFMESIKL